MDRIEQPVTFHGRRLRALHPFDEQDRLLLESVNRGEFTLNGFRNKDLQALLSPTAATTAPGCALTTSFVRSLEPTAINSPRLVARSLPPCSNRQDSDC